MATVQGALVVWNTTAGVKSSGPFAPFAVGNLIVVVHGMSGWASGDDSTITDDNADGLGTYHKIGTATAPLSTGGGTSCALWISVRNALLGSGSAFTVTCTNSGDTGGGFASYEVSGMSRVGSDAVRQTKGESGQTESPVVLTFGSNPLTTNPIILGVTGEDNPANLGGPTGYTEWVDTGHNTPVTGFWTGFISSGITAAAQTFTSGGLTDHNEVGIELDASVPVGLPLLPSIDKLRYAARRSRY